jgi:hypothetical protein
VGNIRTYAVLRRNPSTSPAEPLAALESLDPAEQFAG